MSGRLISSSPNYQREDVCVELACRAPFIAFAPLQNRCKRCGDARDKTLRQARSRKQAAMRKAVVAAKRAQQHSTASSGGEQGIGANQ